jgi:outer membrane usher protein FimD/PapC
MKLRDQVNSLFRYGGCLKTISLKLLVFIFCIAFSSGVVANQPANLHANSDVKLYEIKNAENLPPGIYLVNVASNNKSVGKIRLEVR